MGIFKKIFKVSPREKKLEQKIVRQEEVVSLSLDETFVKKFIEKGGKFLYCTSIEEVIENLKLIMKENKYRRLLCYDHDLLNLAKRGSMRTSPHFSKDLPFFTSCEYLIGKEGDIMFSQNQLGSNKLTDFSENFIVYATTSQIVKNTSEGMQGIKLNYEGNIPSGITNIRYYRLKQKEENFMNYGNSNSKNLYLLLFEDL